MDPRDESEMFTWAKTGSVGACIRYCCTQQREQATVPSIKFSYRAK